MKKIFLILIASIITSANLSAQSCLPQGINFTTQAQIDSFPINYPNCTEIEGYVTISGDDISNLNGLNGITAFDKWLTISMNPILTSLSGLDNLITAEHLFISSNPSLVNLTGLEKFHSVSWFGIENNSSLESLSGLDNLTSVDGTMTIAHNASLTSLSGLENLTTSYASLRIYSNESLTSLSGLENLTSIEFLSIFDNPLLSSLSGLDQLTSVSDGLGIVRSNAMINLEGLNNLSTVGTYSGAYGLHISDNASLTSFSGLDSLTHIDGILNITDNDALTEISSLENLDANSITDLTITGNEFLSSCEASGMCNYLSNPNGTVIIHSNASGCNNPAQIANSCGISLPCLPYGNYYFYTQDEVDLFQSSYVDCKQLNGLTLISGDDITNLHGLIGMSLAGNLEISKNLVLTNLQGLDSLTVVKKDLHIVDNPGLYRLNGLEGLTSIEGDLEISDNPDLNALLGLENLAFIGDDIRIRGNSALSNLNGLESLSFLSDGVLIDNNNSLSSLSGLKNITSIGDSSSYLPTLEICDNDSLENLSGLDNLTHIYGDLIIHGNESLIDMAGLENLTFIDGSLKFYNNENLINMSGLENLSYLGGSLAVGYYPLGGGNPVGNPSLINLAGLEGLSTIGGYWCSIGNNNSLISLSGLDNLTSLHGSFIVNNNISLASLSAIENLTQLNGSISISNNTVLASLSGLDNIDASTIGNLSIYENDSLSYCAVQSVCDYLDSITGEVNIYNNKSGCNSPAEVAIECGINLPCLPFGNYYICSQLEVDSFQSIYPGCTDLQGRVEINGDDITNLYGLDAIHSIEESLDITGNDILPSLSGLSGLTTIGGSLTIEDNPLLTDLSGLENLTTVLGLFIYNNSVLTSLSGVDGFASSVVLLFIRDNDALTNLTGLETMTTAHWLWIEGNDALSSLTGLDNLQSLHAYMYNGGYLSIGNNDALVDLTGLENLTYLEYGGSTQGGIGIYDNDALISLAGIQNIDGTSIQTLRINDNPLLSTCDVESICEFLAINSYATIYNNAPGCNSVEEVEDECTPPIYIVELDPDTELLVYPNPGSGVVHLQYKNSELRTLNFELYSIQGIKVKTLLNEVQSPGEYELEFDVSELPDGIYFIRMQSGDSQATGKLVVIH